MTSKPAIRNSGPNQDFFCILVFFPLGFSFAQGNHEENKQQNDTNTKHDVLGGFTGIGWITRCLVGCRVGEGVAVGVAVGVEVGVGVAVGRGQFSTRSSMRTGKPKSGSIVNSTGVLMGSKPGGGWISRNS